MSALYVRYSRKFYGMRRFPESIKSVLQLELGEPRERFGGCNGGMSKVRVIGLILRIISISLTEEKIF
jgi:hypothetical protein